MRLRVAFGLWAEDPLLMPTVIACTDNYAEDNWGGKIPDFYAEEVEKHKTENGDVREVFIEVDDAVVNRLFDVVLVPASVIGLDVGQEVSPE